MIVLSRKYPTVWFARMIHEFRRTTLVHSIANVRGSVLGIEPMLNLVTLTVLEGLDFVSSFANLAFYFQIITAGKYSFKLFSGHHAIWSVLVEIHKVIVLVHRASFLPFFGLFICNDLPAIGVDKLPFLEILGATQPFKSSAYGVSILKPSLPHPRFSVLNISSGTCRPCCTTLFLQLSRQLQFLLHS